MRHTVPEDEVHYLWDEGNEPTLRIASGDEVVARTREVSDGQITPESTTELLGSLDAERLYPLVGPIYVEGAGPGDTLAVEMLSIETQGWGWTAILPGLGLLPDDFPDPYLRIFDLSGEFAALDDVTLAVPSRRGRARGRFGGNLDVRQLTSGSTLYLPVQVEGALFSCGDAHGAQGDGEVCVTGIEAPMLGVFRFTLHKGRPIPAPQFSVPGALTPRVDADGFYATTGVGPDLYAASQDALRAMIEYLTVTRPLSREDAYLLASLCVDLKISEIVDAGQYVVSAVLPLAVFS